MTFYTGHREEGTDRMRWLGGIIDSVAPSLSKFWEIVKDREALRDAVQELDTTDQLNN